MPVPDVPDLGRPLSTISTSAWGRGPSSVTHTVTRAELAVVPTGVGERFLGDPVGVRLTGPLSRSIAPGLLSTMSYAVCTPRRALGDQRGRVGQPRLGAATLEAATGRTLDVGPGLSVSVSVSIGRRVPSRPRICVTASRALLDRAGASAAASGRLARTRRAARRPGRR